MRERQSARIAGLLYYSTHLTSVAAVVLYGASLTDRHFVTTAGSTTQVIVAVAFDLLLALGVVGTGVVLLPILRVHSAAGAYAFSALRTVEAAVIAVGTLPMLTLVGLHSAWSTGAPVGATAIGEALVGLHQASFLVGQGLVISVNTVVLSSLLLRSRIVPLWIGVLGAAGGTAVLISNVAQLFGLVPRAGALAGAGAVLAFAFEICFAGYLVIRGTMPPRVRPVDGFTSDLDVAPESGRVR